MLCLVSISRRLVAVVTIASCCLSFYGCTAFFFHPDRILRVTPDRLGLPYEELTIKSLDGTDLTTWLLKSKLDFCKGTVVFFHGNAENISSHIQSIYWLPRYGYEVFMVDYRGYGGSDGRPFTSGVHEDVRAALDFVTSDSRFCRKRLVVLGQSLGGALAITATAKFPRKDLIDGVIVESTFAGYKSVARHVISRVPVIGWLSAPLSVFTYDHLSPERYIARLSPSPVLIIHGANDPMIPISEAERLFAAAKGPAEFWRLEESGHIGAFRSEAERLRLLRFLDALPARTKVHSDSTTY